jgi:alpha-D-ribose 1-methylphosphonate 5-triphosphate synthase subunit PhnH
MYTADEALARETFLALMWSLSYPGRVYTIPDANPFMAIAHTLLDLETTFFTLDVDLAGQLAATGARGLPVDEAAYHFYPVLNDLDTVRQASVGTMLFPDRAATLVIGCRLESGQSLRLSGPGVDGQRAVQVGGLPAAFWSLRQKVNQYPLGWDIYLIDGQRVIGLPRTTMVEG